MNTGSKIVSEGPATSLVALVIKVTTTGNRIIWTVTSICVSVASCLYGACLLPQKVTWSIRSKLVPVTVISLGRLKVTG